jgi:hypothetical protein
MSERENTGLPVQGPGAGAEALASMSEVDLLLTLAEMGDLIEAYVTLHGEVADVAEELTEACAALADIEDELVRRGFSHRIFCT